MVILGFNGGFGGGHQDTAAVLIQNGKIISAVEEERLNRVKHAQGQIPYLAIIEVLELAKFEATDIDLVCFHGATWGKFIEEDLRQYFINHFSITPKFKLFHHHLCHAAAVFYTSPFKSSLVLTVDNSGDGDSTHIYKGDKKTGLTLLRKFERPQSLGLFYSLITQYCGFSKDWDEYKVMAMAALGKPVVDLDFLLTESKNGYQINENYLVDIPAKTPSPTRQKMLFNRKFSERLGFEKAYPSNPLEAHYNLASSAQLLLEKILVNLVENSLKQINEHNICLAGGVALNCVANSKISSLNSVKEFYTNSVSSDAGVALGAAILGSLDFENKTINGYTPFAGREYSNDEIKAIISSLKIKATYVEQPELFVANKLKKNETVAVFKGKAEFGPRALGNRTIYANPFKENIQEELNQTIKDREGFRPFGVIIRKMDLSIYFEHAKNESPFMNMVYMVKADKKESLKEVMHHDGTCRVQTVENGDLLLSDDLPILINTSFNSRNEPMVYSPVDAIKTFYGTGLNYLVLENWLITKE
tara:strand:- start:191 stop:1786 length:1596 start_codon:yes stop_codon:yes gene_type:complete